MTLAPMLFVHFISTLLMVGLIWFVQVVHYPLMAAVGPECFGRYSHLHQSRTTYVVAGPMLVEVATAVYLLVAFPALRTSWAILTADALLALAWASTAWLQVPIHQSFTTGYDELQIHRLVRTNWIRTIAWTLRAVLIGGLLWPKLSP